MADALMLSEHGMHCAGPHRAVALVRLANTDSNCQCGPGMHYGDSAIAQMGTCSTQQKHPPSIMQQAASRQHMCQRLCGSPEQILSRCFNRYIEDGQLPTLCHGTRRRTCHGLKKVCNVAQQVNTNITWNVLYQVPSDQAPHTTRCPSLNFDAPSPSASTTPTPCSEIGAVLTASDADLNQPASGVTAVAHRPPVCHQHKAPSDGKQPSSLLAEYASQVTVLNVS